MSKHEPARCESHSCSTHAEAMSLVQHKLDTLPEVGYRIAALPAEGKKWVVYIAVSAGQDAPALPKPIMDYLAKV